VDNVKDKDELYPVRIFSSWSKTVNLIYITYADTTYLPEREPIKVNAVKNLCKQW